MKYKRILHKKCGWCGKAFETGRNNQFYCSAECSQARKKQTRIEWKTKEAARPKARYVESLAEINQKARDAGMSYGKYMLERQCGRVYG